MARILDQARHAQKRNEILNVAERMILSRSYEGMTVQQLIEELEISKGAFYYYFKSKLEVIEALIERRFDAVAERLRPIAFDPDKGAISKLSEVFGATAEFKSEQKELLLSVLPVYLDDGNALFRQKLRAAKVRRLSPVIAHIIRQGIEEGTIRAAHPERAAELVWRLEQDMSDSVGESLLQVIQGHDIALAPLRAIIATYQEAIARVLGIPDNTLCIGAEGLDDWAKAASEGARAT